MEYVRGGSLSVYLKKTGPLPINNAVDIIAKTCVGLEALHKSGITHHDLKPGNILLTEDLQPKISDFGISSDRKDGRQIQDSRILGTLQYMSPEYIKTGLADRRSDIYALGVVAYEIIAGKPPFPRGTIMESMVSRMKNEAQPLHEARADVPRGLCEVIQKAMNTDPDKRFQNAGQFSLSLRAFGSARWRPASNMVRWLSKQIEKD